MIRYFTRTLLLLIGVSFLVFSLDTFIPGDPAQVLAGENATRADIERIHRQLDLDRPVLARYAAWATNIAHGDLGQSLFTSRSVRDEIVERLPVTLSLVVLALAIGTVLGVAAGVGAALNSGRFLDRLFVMTASLGVAVPNFWIGLLMVIAFSINWRLLPATGYVPLVNSPLDWLAHLLLPALALSTAPAAELTRQVRGAVIDILSRDYVRTAVAKGLPNWLVIGKHVLKNTGVTVTTIMGIQISVLLGASVVIEQIFGLPGIGGLVVQSVFSRDLPIVQGVVLVTALLILTTNLMVDISHRYFNPRMRSISL